MIRRFTLATLFVVLSFFNLSLVQAADESETEPQAIVSLYHVAPGKHHDFLKWMEAREAIAKSQGIAATQWYMHWSGDSWDFMAISPVTTDEQNQKLDDAAKAKGMTGGMAAGMELRTMMMSHTDTWAGGPYTASELMKQMNE